MKFNLSDPNFVLLLIGLLLIVGCVISSSFGFTLKFTEGFENQETPTPQNQEEEEEEIVITSPPVSEDNSELTQEVESSQNIQEESPIMMTPMPTQNIQGESPVMMTPMPTQNVQGESPVMITPMPSQNVQEELPIMMTPMPAQNVQEESDAPESGATIPSLHTPTPNSVQLINQIPSPSASTEETESTPMTDHDREERPSEDAKSNQSNEKASWVRRSGIHHGRRLDSTPRIPNISQIGGQGPSNYFHPNIVISRGSNQPQTHRIEFGLGKEITSMLGAFGQSGSHENESQENNIGFNFGQSYEQEQENYYDPENDPFNTAKTNIRRSYAQELKQKGQSKLCHDDIIKQKAQQESFQNSQKNREYHPGFQYIDPKYWSVPQKRPPVCLGRNDKCLPAGVFDRGTPLNALEVTANTQVGSIMPKFKYTEAPRS